MFYLYAVLGCEVSVDLMSLDACYMHELNMVDELYPNIRMVFDFLPELWEMIMSACLFILYHSSLSFQSACAGSLCTQSFQTGMTNPGSELGCRRAITTCCCSHLAGGVSPVP